MSQKNWNDMTTEEQVEHAAKGLLDRYREQNPDEVDLTEEQMKFGGDAGGGKSAPHPGVGGKLERERLTREAKYAIALAVVDAGDAIGNRNADGALSRAISHRLKERGVQLTIPELSAILDSFARGITVFVAAVKPMQEMSAGYGNPVAIAGSGPGGGSAYATGSGSVAIGGNGGCGYGAGGGGGKQASGFTVGAGGGAGGGKSAPHPGVGGELDLTTGIFRHCGVQPDDDWVKRVERLNAIIDGLNGRGEAVGGAIVGTVVV